MPRVTACATLGYASLDLETALKQISRRGFAKVEITELGAYCKHLPCGEASMSAVREMLERHCLTPVAMNVSTSRAHQGTIKRLQLSDPADADRAYRYARWFFEAARQLGISIVTFPIGARVLDETEWLSEMKKSSAVYRKIAEMASGYGLSLHLEVPHLFQLTDTVEHVYAILEEVDHPSLGATVDSSHWGIIRYDLPAFIRNLGEKLRHVHLRDSAGGDSRDYRQNLEMTPGKGTVDFGFFGRTLDELGYDREVTLDFEYCTGDLQAIESEYDQGIAHLRRCGWEFPWGVRP